MKTKFLFLVIVSILLVNTSRAQWQLMAGPYGLNTTNIVQYNSKWFASTTNGLMESVNFGSDWVRSSQPFNIHINSHLANENEKIVFNGVYQQNAYLSIDSGNTWSTIVPDSSFPVLRMQIESGNLYAWCTYSTIHISHDNGVTWLTPNRPVQNNLNDMQIRNGRLYLLYDATGTGTGGVYYSDDDGINWSPLGTTGIPGSAVTHPFRMRFSGNAIYVLYNYYGVYKSIDGGNTWSFFNTGLPGTFYTNPRIAYFDVEKDKVYVWSNLHQGLYWSDTTAASFTNISTGLPLEATGEQVLKRGNTIYSATTGGLFSTDKSNVNWQFTGRGVSEMLFNTIECQDTNVFVGHNSGFTVSHDNGSSFLDIVTSISTSSFFRNQFSTTAATSYGLGSNDGGNTWYNINFPYGYYGQQLTSYCENNIGLIGLNIDGTLKSSVNGGASWATLTFPGGTPYCLGSSANSFFIGTFSGIYKAIGIGGGWAPTLSGNEINKIITDNGVTYAISTTGNAIWYTTNDGASWSSLNYPGADVNSVGVHSGIVVVAPEMKVTVDFGLHWYDLNMPLPNNESVDLIALNNDYLFAIHSDSLYRLSSAFLTSVPEKDQFNDITLFPVPAQNELFIKLNQKISASDKIEVRINDLTGRLIFKERLSEMNNERINISTFPKGMLILELHSGGGVVYRNFVHL